MECASTTSAIHCIVTSARQPDLRREAAEPCPQDFGAVLVDGAPLTHKTALFGVFLNEGDGASDGIADIDRREILEVHLSGEETDHAADVRQHATRQQSGNDATAKPAFARKEVILVVGVEVAGDAAEERHIALSEGAAVSKRLPHLKLIEGFAQALLEWCACCWRFWNPWYLRHLLSLALVDGQLFSYIRRSSLYDAGTVLLLYYVAKPQAIYRSTPHMCQIKDAMGRRSASWIPSESQRQAHRTR